MAGWSVRRRLGHRVRQFLARAALHPQSGSGAAGAEFPGELGGLRLAVTKLDGVGDLVLGTTFLRPFHDSEICKNVTLFCRTPGAALAAAQFPRWRIVELPPLAKPVRSMFLDRTLRRRLLDQPVFDLLLDLRAGRDLGDSVFVSWIPARCKVAFQNQVETADVRLEDESRIYDRLLPRPSRADERVPQEIANFREFARLLLPTSEPAGAMLPQLMVGADLVEEVREVLTADYGLAPADSFLLVCPGSLHPIKEYPPRRLAAALQPVLRNSSLVTVIAGGRNDLRTTGPLKQALQSEGIKTVDLTGRLDLVQHVALVSQAAVVACMDSSTAHIAGALKRPAVVLLGGGHPGRFGPWGESKTFRWLTHRTECYGCSWICSQSYPRCVQDIPESAITDALLETIAHGYRNFHVATQNQATTE